MSDNGKDNFATAGMAEALNGDINGNGTQDNATPGPDGDAAAKAREKGWVPPEAYNYGAYNAPHGSSSVDADTAAPPNLPEWGHKAARYEWQEDFGDIGPANPALEEVLFRGEFQQRSGLLLDQLTAFKVTVEGTTRPEPVLEFKDAGLHPIIMKNIELCGYLTPTPIQAYTIPSVLTGHDIIGIAQTGSGKTAAFLLPAISRLTGKAKKLAAPRPNLSNGFNQEVDMVRAEPLILVVAPTRELACQIFDEARRLCYRSMLRPCVVYGGGPVREQREELAKGCDILIATPGRLRDFMDKPHVLSLNRVRFTIIDEADELLHDDWLDDLEKIMSGGDTNEDADHRYMMFSATFPRALREVARKYLSSDHIRIRVGRTGSSHKNISQRVVFVEEPKKKQALYDLLMSMPPSRTLIFVNNKRQADFLDDFLYNQALPSTSIHSDRTQREREDALRSFRTAKSPILITTGVSARGLDIKNVMHVINFDLPSVMYGGIDEYIHRIGRTARIGHRGLATSFYNDKDEDIAPALVQVLIETSHEVPDFLARYVPEDGKLHFDDDTDNEGEETEAAGDAWGAQAQPANEGGAWGTDNPAGGAWRSSNAANEFASGGAGGGAGGWQDDPAAGSNVNQTW